MAGDDVYAYVSASMPSLIRVINFDGTIDVLLLLRSSIGLLSDFAIPLRTRHAFFIVLCHLRSCTGQNMLAALFVSPSLYEYVYNPQDLNNASNVVYFGTTANLRFSCGSCSLGSSFQILF